jgi:thiol-disulfide isomerase/thioredoxin
MLVAALGVGCGTDPDAAEPHQSGHAMMGGEVREKHFDRVPAFVFKDLDGNEVSSEQFRGQVLLVDVWATWCPPCKEEMPWFQELQDSYGDRGLEVIGISIDPDPAAAARFAKELKVNYTMLHRPEIMQEWGLLGLPTTFVVDRGGVIRRRVVGFEYKEAFEAAVRELL